jgi:hypothetical protein
LAGVAAVKRKAGSKKVKNIFASTLNFAKLLPLNNIAGAGEQKVFDFFLLPLIMN